MRTSALFLLLLGLALSVTPACKKQEEGPSIKARGYSEGSQLPKSGESGQATSSSMTTDADGRRFEELEFMSDGVSIGGTLVLPKRTDPAPAVVLVHMLGRDRSTWKEFQLLLADEGIGSFAIDLRGHGSSEGGPGGYEAFNPAEWQAALSDVRNAVLALEEFPDRINTDRLGVIGASIGANYAIELGAEMPRLVVVALSAGKSYKGVDSEAALLKVKRQAFLAGQTGDEPAAELLLWAQDSVPEAAFFEEEGTAHGTAMLPNGNLEAQILAFIRGRWGVKPDEPGGGLDGGLPEDLPLIDDPVEEAPQEEDPAFEEFAPPEEEVPVDDGGGADDGGGVEDGGATDDGSGDANAEDDAEAEGDAGDASSGW